jgi:DNA-binding YbaB/EbfC family protein
MSNLAGMMKQAMQVQTRLQEAQEALAKLEMTGEAGAGLVRVTLNGKGELRGVAIDPKVVDPADTEMLQDLIVAAHRAAKAKIDAASQEEMQKVTGGLKLPPGMKLPF